MSGTQTTADALEAIFREALEERNKSTAFRSERSAWRTFERFKERVGNLALEPAEYERAVIQLADALDV